MNFEYLKDFMDRLTAWRIPGNEVSVCLGNKEVFRYASGYSDYENKVPMETNKWLYNIYSCSKPATVTAALQLYEKGMFLLDDPLYDFIPEFKQMYIHNEDGSVKKSENPITIRHLFTMTSGLTYNSQTKGFEKAREITEGKMNTLEVIKNLAADGITFEPGTRWQYGLSHDVLAGVVEVISGKKFRDYVTDNIFKPLGMNESFYHNDEVLDRLAEQYSYENSQSSDLVKLQSEGSGKADGYLRNVGKKVSHYVFGSEYDSGGAGITTSVSDYSKFCCALANWGLGANGERILAKSTVELLRTNQLSEEIRKDLSWTQLKGYGYGLGVRTMIDKAESGSTGNVGEFGWGGAAGANILVDPDIGLSVFYAHHMLNPQEDYYQPRLRNVVYTCINS